MRIIPMRTALVALLALVALVASVAASSTASGAGASSTFVYNGSDDDRQVILDSGLLYEEGCSGNPDPITCLPDFFPGTVWARIQVGVNTTIVSATTADFELDKPSVIQQGQPAKFSTTLTTRDAEGKEIVVTTTPFVNVDVAYDSPFANCPKSKITTVEELAAADTSNCLNTVLHTGDVDLGTFTLLEKDGILPYKGTLNLSETKEGPSFDVGALVGVPGVLKVRLDFVTKLNLTAKEGFQATRTIASTHEGTDLLSGTLHWNDANPVQDNVPIPCDAKAGDSLVYRLDDNHWGGNGVATGTVTAVLELFDAIDLFTINVASATLFDSGVRADTADFSRQVGIVSKDKGQPVITAVNVPADAEKGTPLTFSATATDNCNSGVDLHYKWTFDDGGVAFGPVVAHTFKAPGFHTGTVSVSDKAGNVDERDFSVVVGINGNTNIKYEGPIGLSANDPGPLELSAVLLDWQGRGIKGQPLQFSILDEAGAPLPGYPIVNTTDVNGRARVSIIPPLPCLCTVEVEFKGDPALGLDPAVFAKSFTVHTNRPPVVNPLPNPGKTVWGVPIEFSGFATDPDGGAPDTLKFLWSFGDGTSAINNKVSHAFAKHGTYTVSLTVTDKDGGSTTVSREVTINKRSTHIANCGPAQTGMVTSGTGTNKIPVCLQLFDEFGNPVISRSLSYALQATATTTYTVTGFTDALGKYQAAIVRALGSGCYNVTTSFDGSADNQYKSSTYSFIWYQVGNPALVCTLVPAAPTSAAMDVNCDGAANGLDVEYILQVVAGLAPFSSCWNVANVNGDGTIDALDALYLLQVEAGLIELG